MNLNINGLQVQGDPKVTQFLYCQ